MNAITSETQNFSCTTQAGADIRSWTSPDAPTELRGDLAGGMPSNAPLISKTGRWGGPRANSGGARPGAGRKPNAAPTQRAIQSKPLGPRWYVVELAFGAGARVIRDIVEGESREGREPRPGYRAEMPLIAARRLRRGQWVVDHIPMFGGYAFVLFDAVADDWAPIRHIEGVAKLFMTKSERPIPLPVGFVEWLIDTAADRLSLKAARMIERQPGELLSVADGPFVDLPAVCVECDGLNTTAHVEIFGRNVPVTLPYGAFVGRA